MDAGTDLDEVYQRKLSMTAYVNSPDIDYEGGELLINTGQMKLEVSGMKKVVLALTLPLFAFTKSSL